MKKVCDVLKSTDRVGRGTRFAIKINERGSENGNERKRDILPSPKEKKFKTCSTYKKLQL